MQNRPTDIFLETHSTQRTMLHIVLTQYFTYSPVVRHIRNWILPDRNHKPHTIGAMRRGTACRASASALEVVIPNSSVMYECIKVLLAGRVQSICEIFASRRLPLAREIRSVRAVVGYTESGTSEGACVKWDTTETLRNFHSDYLMTLALWLIPNDMIAIVIDQFCILPRNYTNAYNLVWILHRKVTGQQLFKRSTSKWRD